jgi:hypothetical protein
MIFSDAVGSGRGSGLVFGFRFVQGLLGRDLWVMMLAWCDLGGTSCWWCELSAIVTVKFHVDACWFGRAEGSWD